MKAPASRLRINLLGSAEILLDGAPLSLNHVKARALLFFMAGTGARHSRDYLASLLWSESAANDAHHSLRSAVYRLRQAIEPESAGAKIISDGDMLYLEPKAFGCDALEFRRLIQIGDEASLQRAASLYRGPFLQGFSTSGAAAFEEWVQVEDSFFSQASRQALDRLAYEAEQRSDLAAAIHYLQQAIQVEPLAEDVQQRLISIHLRRGEPGLALRQFRRFEAELREELGLEPAEETRALLRDALRLQGRSGQVPEVASKSVRRPQLLPLVGRQEPLEQVQQVAEAAEEGNGATILIEGEGGIGKSRLLEEVSTRLIRAPVPWLVLRGACTPFDDLRSQGPFLEALEEVAPGELRELLAHAENGASDARGQFPWHVLQTIRSLCRNAPVLLMIEDLQWASSSTLNLFGFLAMRLHHLPVLLMGSVQQPEAIPSLQRLIALQRHRGELSVLHLAALNVGDVSDVLQAAGLDPGPVESLAEWLTARSAGNPFLLGEVMAQMRAEGVLQRAGENWQLNATRWLQWRARFSLPETTYDLVSWRLSNLDATARHILDILAVAGSPLPESVLGRLMMEGSGNLAASIDDLTARGLMMELPGGLLGLPHHLLMETLLHGLSSVRRRAICRQMAAAFEDALPAQVRRIALYAVAGDDAERARRYGLQALSELSQQSTGAENIDFVQHLHDLLLPTAAAEEMVRLTSALGSLHQSAGNLELAAQWQAQNLEWAGKAQDRAAQASAYFDMAELALMSNDYHAALEAAQRGLAGAEVPGSSPGELAARGHRLLGAAYAMEGGDLVSAERHLQEALAVHRQAGDQADLCATVFELGNIAAQRGQLQRAIDLYGESAQAAETGHIPYYLALARNNFAYHSLLLGNVGDAEAAVSQGIKVADSHGLLAALLHLYSTQGEVQLYLADWQHAEASFRRGLAIAEELGSLERQAGYRGGLALAARGQGDLAAAERLLREALDLIAGQGYWHLRTRLQLWLAETLRRQQRRTEAKSLVEEAISVSHAHQRSMLFVQAQRLRAQLAAQAGDWPAAQALFTEALASTDELGLPLEAARVRAAWGTAAEECSPGTGEARVLLDTARSIFSDRNALGDLAGLS